MHSVVTDILARQVLRLPLRDLARVVTCMMFLALVYLASPAMPLRAETLRHVTPLDSGWLFKRADVKDGGQIGLETSDWQKVSIPHSFNDTDPATGGQYYRGPVWYRRMVIFDGAKRGERTYLEFDGVALASDIWINGEKVGRHEGGYARFRFDVTPFLKSGNNVLAVRVDNTRMESILPLGGDFTVFGGIYRPARLVTTRAIHFDMLDFGGPGVYVTPSNVKPVSADIRWLARVTNDQAEGRSSRYW